MPTASHLDRLFELLAQAFTPEVARKLADLRAEPEVQARIDVLADKANDGTLTPEEDCEYKSYVEAVDIIGAIQAKARRYLAVTRSRHG